MKTILHLCADTGSDSYIYSQVEGYEVIRIGEDIGVENYIPDRPIYGVMANPPCTEFSRAVKGGQPRDTEKGFELVFECLRIINEAKPKWYYIENPASGALKSYLGKPRFSYQPYQFGSPWSKRTSLWGSFKLPQIKYKKWTDVPDEIKIPELYIRPTATYANGQTRVSTGVPSLAFQHAHTHMKYIKEFEPFYTSVLSKPSRMGRGRGADMEFRSLCSQKFAQAFYDANK